VSSPSSARAQVATRSAHPRLPDALDELARADRKRVTKFDGSVQLRLEGIDTPETRFGKFAQPLGDKAGDWLLEHTGLTRSSSTPAAR
jgi:hypothetical protein